jgi:hypothetical protein
MKFDVANFIGKNKGTRLSPLAEAKELSAFYVAL